MTARLLSAVAALSAFAAASIGGPAHASDADSAPLVALKAGSRLVLADDQDFDFSGGESVARFSKWPNKAHRVCTVRRNAVSKVTQYHLAAKDILMVSDIRVSERTEEIPAYDNGAIAAACQQDPALQFCRRSYYGPECRRAQQHCVDVQNFVLAHPLSYSSVSSYSISMRVRGQEIQDPDSREFDVTVDCENLNLRRSKEQTLQMTLGEFRDAFDWGFWVHEAN